MRKRIEQDYSWNGSSWIETNEVRFIDDGNLVVQERDANNTPQVTYTRGNDLSGTLQGAGGIGGLLARTENPKLLISDPFATAYYFADGQGNIVEMAYTNGLVAAQYRYDPFGNMISMSGPMANANKHRFSSKEWNGNAGLYYYGYRFYDPNLQRWPNRDPIGDKSPLLRILLKNSPLISPAKDTIINRYWYVNNNPLDNGDYLGLWTIGFRIDLSVLFWSWQVALTFDNHGHFENTWSSCTGITGGASLTGGLTATSAESVEDLRGESYSVGLAGGEGWAGEINAVGRNGSGAGGENNYGGLDVGFGVGGGLPITPQAFKCNTSPIQ
ncbi:MAG: RHS repeat-associated core domain-containing protein [Limisphaerales bacterium]